MSLLGKILAILNIAAASAFLYLAAMDYGVRQTWSYAVFRHDVALRGLPVDKEERDEHGRLRYLAVNENLARELTGDKYTTQEEVLDARSNELQAKIDDPADKRSKLDKYVEVLVQLANSASEREQLLARRLDKGNQDYSKLAAQFKAHFETVRKMKGGQPKDREGKRQAIARTLVSLLGVLPTAEERKRQEEEKKKTADKRADPTADAAYRRVLNVVGIRMMARTLDLQGRNLLVMSENVAAGRKQEQALFVEQHQSLINALIDREHRLLATRDQLEIKKAQLAIQVKRAEEQEALAKSVREELDKAQQATAEQLDRVAKQQQRLFEVRVRLRDANRINQAMEALVRKLAFDYKSKQR